MKKKTIIGIAVACVAIAGIIYYKKDKEAAKKLFSDIKGAAIDTFRMHKSEFLGNQGAAA